MNEYESIYDAEMRRRKLHEAMLQQAMAPQGTQYAGNRAVPYHPLQGLTTLGQALIARSAMDSGEQRLADARKSQEEKRRALAEAVMAKYRGAPEVPAVTAPLLGPPQFPEGQQVITPATPAVPPNPQEAMLLAASQPETAEMAKYIGMTDKADRGGYFTPRETVVPDGKGGTKIIYEVFNHRTGKWEKGEGPVSPKTPTMRQQVRGAEITGEAEAKRAFGMAGLGETIDEARNILTLGEPTESGIGRAVDFMARQVGVSTKGAQQAAQLETIGGALTSKMPRMEGPQSDFDRLNYEQMAAKVGDRSVPREERLAALDSMEKIWRKYEPLNQEKPKQEKPKKEAPPQAIEFLRKNNTPEMQRQFKLKYGYLP